jgi:hypothetical protein
MTPVSTPRTYVRVRFCPGWEMSSQVTTYVGMSCVAAPQARWKSSLQVLRAETLVGVGFLGLMWFTDCANIHQIRLPFSCQREN